MAHLLLDNVTLCAASDVAIEATLRAMSHSLDQARFGDALFFSSKNLALSRDTAIRHVPIEPLRSREAYSHFILRDLAAHVRTDFALIVQWDGFIVDASAWTDNFLAFDYIGAPWIDRPAPFNVGNGGFSLRSKRLLEAGSAPWFELSHPEDLSICVHNREHLLADGIQIADQETARRFSREREAPSGPHFGIHGIFALAEVMDRENFDALLSTVEFGVIGKRELLDLIAIHAPRRGGSLNVVRRCAGEFLRRYPFDRRALRVALSAVGAILDRHVTRVGTGLAH